MGKPAGLAATLKSRKRTRSQPRVRASVVLSYASLGSAPEGGRLPRTRRCSRTPTATFYGTTSGGGAVVDEGTACGLSVGLGPFVKTLPPSGKVGAAGTVAVFKVVSASEITTAVPRRREQRCGPW